VLGIILAIEVIVGRKILLLYFAKEVETLDPANSGDETVNCINCLKHQYLFRFRSHNLRLQIGSSRVK